MPGTDNPGSDASERSIGEITELLNRWSAGDLQARSELFSSLYPALKLIAERRMRGERSDHTLQPTAIVSEFFLRIAGSSGANWNNRSHFLAVASKAMRRVLIDHARKHNSETHGGGAARIELDLLQLPSDLEHTNAVEIDELIDCLAAKDPRMAQVVEMRCFGGLTHEEVGDALRVDARTVKRDWRIARAWLIAQLRKSNSYAGRSVGTD